MNAAMSPACPPPACFPLTPAQPGPIWDAYAKH